MEKYKMPNLTQEQIWERYSKLAHAVKLLGILDRIEKGEYPRTAQDGVNEAYYKTIKAFNSLRY